MPTVFLKTDDLSQHCNLFNIQRFMLTLNAGIAYLNSRVPATKIPLDGYMKKNYLHDPATVLDPVKKTLQKYQMLQKGDRVLACVSGGSDSVALVRILKILKNELAFDLGVAHFNHGLRGKSSDRDEIFVQSLAAECELPYYVQTGDVKKYCKNNKLSIEHGARRLRYAFFDHIADRYGFNKIALGHHADDNAEVVLMALLRGSGPLGLAGIPPVRDQKIIRPLIHLSKARLGEFLEINKWSFMIDETNRSTDYLRNRIRLQLIPLLEGEYNPRVVEALNRVSNILMMENSGLEKWTEDLVKTLVRKEPFENGETGYSFSIPDISDLHAAQQRRFIRRVIKEVKGNLKRITFAHVDTVIQLMKRDKYAGAVHLPDKILVLKKDSRMIISKKAQTLRSLENENKNGQTKAYQHVVNCCETIELRDIDANVIFSEFDREKNTDICYAGQEIAFFDIKKAKFPMILRNFNTNDRFVPLGMTGSQSVKKFLKDHKIPADERCRVPVLVIDGQVAWVGGHRIDDRFKVTDKTQKILKVEIQRP